MSLYKSFKKYLFSEDKPAPLVFETTEKLGKNELSDWISSHKAEVDTELTEHGALLFRGFDIQTAQDFEDVALSIDKDLKNDYLGTSPRNSRSKFVFSASELPDHYPIMQHCEMSFLAKPPRKLFFYCHVEPHDGGETPICDFRKVIAQMDPKIKQDFMDKGIRTIRNYDGPNQKSPFKLFQLKKWDEIFHTTDHKEVEAKCKEYGIIPEWRGKNKLRLINEQPATKKHPKTGEEVWFNHLTIFHAEAAAIEYKKILAYRRQFRTWRISFLLSTFTFLKRIIARSKNYSMHTTFLDGSQIPRSYVQHIEDLIWKNLSIFKWKQGDLLAIDNFSTSHGRLPYTGERDILVCWSED